MRQMWSGSILMLRRSGAPGAASQQADPSPKTAWPASTKHSQRRYQPKRAGALFSDIVVYTGCGSSRAGYLPELCTPSSVQRGLLGEIDFEEPPRRLWQGTRTRTESSLCSDLERLLRNPIQMRLSASNARGRQQCIKFYAQPGHRFQQLAKTLKRRQDPRPHAAQRLQRRDVHNSAFTFRC
jgi:hypothetical protein